MSKEEFTLQFDDERQMYQTFPQPSEDILPAYYHSQDYISHTNSKRNLFESLYHAVRSVTLKSKLRLITRHQNKAKICLLDVGCGTGDFLAAAKAKGWITTGIEPNAQARDLAKAKGVEVLEVEQLNKFDQESFDVITLWHVLEHLPNLEDHIRLFKKLLKRNGLLVIAVPNFKSYDANYYGPAWAAFDVPRHLWHFSKESIQILSQRHDLQLIAIKPMWFDAFYVSILSEKHKGSRLSFLKGMLVGLVSNISGLLKSEYSSHIYILKVKL